MKVLRAYSTLSASGKRRNARELRRYERFCRPHPGRPFTAESILAFLKFRAPHVTKEYFRFQIINAFRRWFADHNRRSPLDTPDVMARMRRLSNRTLPALPYEYLTSAQLRRIFAAARAVSQQIPVVIALVYYSRASCVELAAMDLADVSISLDGMTIRTIGTRPYIRVSRVDEVSRCPVALMEAWIAERGAVPGPLFVSSSQSNRGARLTWRAFPKLIRCAFAAAHIPTRNAVKRLQRSMLVLGKARGASNTDLAVGARLKSGTALANMPHRRRFRGLQL